MSRAFVLPGTVRCLAPGAKEHTFFSPDRAKVRVCPKCRARLSKNAGLPAPGLLAYRPPLEGPR